MEMEKAEDLGKSELVLVLVCHCIAMYTAGPASRFQQTSPD